MIDVAFYISGHGFGHASRQIEIANALGASILIRSTAPRWLFERTLRTPFVLDARPVDTGMVQIDSLSLNPAATIARAHEFYATLEARAQDEAQLLRGHGVRLVVADAPPLACRAARLAGIPSFVVANFTWDWIYRAYSECLDSAPDLIPAIERAYGDADGAWRLPMHGGFETVTGIQDVPFVARHATRGRDETRAVLGLPGGRRLALSSFGGYGVQDVRLDALDTGPEWEVIVTGTSPPPARRGVHFVSEPALYGAGLRYEDLVAACDVVVTKPGYGIISECIASGTPLVYTSRGRFAEYDVLVAAMPRYLRCAFLAQDALRAGRWRDALADAVGRPPPPERPRTDGAPVIADMIAACSAAAASSPLRPPP